MDNDRSARMTVVLMVAVSFLVFTVGRSPNNIQLPEQGPLAAWAGIAIILAIAVDMGPTGELAAAMAVLIFVTVMLLYGVDVFEWLQRKAMATSSPKNDIPNPVKRRKHA